MQIIHDLHNPVIMIVPDRRVSVTAHFVVGLGHGRGDGVRVQVTGCGSMGEADDGAMLEGDEFGIGVERGGAPFGEEGPLVVVVFVVIAGDLLLLRARWEGLDVRVEEATTIADIFESDS